VVPVTVWYDVQKVMELLEVLDYRMIATNTGAFTGGGDES
jgi:hypothetical protein